MPLYTATRRLRTRVASGCNTKCYKIFQCSFSRAAYYLVAYDVLVAATCPRMLGTLVVLASLIRASMRTIVRAPKTDKGFSLSVQLMAVLHGRSCIHKCIRPPSCTPAASLRSCCRCCTCGCLCHRWCIAAACTAVLLVLPLHKQVCLSFQVQVWLQLSGLQVSLYLSWCLFETAIVV